MLKTPFEGFGKTVKLVSLLFEIPKQLSTIVVAEATFAHPLASAKV